TDCPDRIPPGKRFKWDLRGEVELKDLITWASATLCKAVIVPTNIRSQKVQIYAPATMTQAEAYRMFLAAVNSMGIALQPQGARPSPVATPPAPASRRSPAPPPTAPLPITRRW